jgi:hypothetical protein
MEEVNNFIISLCQLFDHMVHLKRSQTSLRVLRSQLEKYWTRESFGKIAWQSLDWHSSSSDSKVNGRLLEEWPGIDQQLQINCWNAEWLQLSLQVRLKCYGSRTSFGARIPGWQPFKQKMFWTLKTSWSSHEKRTLKGEPSTDSTSTDQNMFPAFPGLLSI